MGSWPSLEVGVFAGDGMDEEKEGNVFVGQC